MLADVTALPLRLAVLAVTLCLSAFFSGSETALFSFQPDELNFMDRPDAGPADRAVAALRRNPKRLLVTILFGNMVVNTVFFSVSFVLILELSPKLPAWAEVLLGFASLVAVIVAGEVTPKHAAVALYRPCGRAAALPIMLLQKALSPVLVPLEKVADWALAAIERGEPPMQADELRLLAAVGAREGVLDEGAGRMISDVIGASVVRVREIMVPRVDMIAFDLRKPAPGLMVLFQLSKPSFVAVYEGSTDHVRGIIRFTDLLMRRPGRPLKELVSPVPFIPETTTVEEALRCCRREHSDAAFVVDEYGVLVGMVTPEALVEEIVGEMAGEFDLDEVPQVERLEDGSFRVRGLMSLREWQELTGLELPDLSVDTLGGLVMAVLGKVPETGDTGRCGRMEFLVESMDGHRVDMLLVRLRGAREGQARG